jgi:hypothetical protein
MLDVVLGVECWYGILVAVLLLVLCRWEFKAGKYSGGV